MLNVNRPANERREFEQKDILIISSGQKLFVSAFNDVKSKRTHNYCEDIIMTLQLIILCIYVSIHLALLTFVLRVRAYGYVIWFTRHDMIFFMFFGVFLLPFRSSNWTGFFDSLQGVKMHTHTLVFVPKTISMLIQFLSLFPSYSFRILFVSPKLWTHFIHT